LPPIAPHFASTNGSKARPLQEAIDDLHDGLRAAKGTIQHLTHVLQGEQERASALEASLVVERARVDDLTEKAKNAKLRDDQHLHTMHALRKDLLAMEGSMREAVSRLGEHHGMHGATSEQLRSLGDGHGSTCRQLEGLEQHAVDIRRDLDQIAQQAREGIEQLRSDLTQRLDEVSAEASERLQRLSGDQQQTSRRLQEVVDTIVAPMCKQVEQCVARLDLTEEELARLGSQGASHRECTDALQNHAADLTAETESLRARLDGLHALHRDLSAVVEGATADVQVHHDRLDVTSCAVDGFRESEREMHSLLRQARADAAEACSAVAEQKAFGQKLVGELEALRHGLEVTDGEVQDIRALLEVPA